MFSRMLRSTVVVLFVVAATPLQAAETKSAVEAQALVQSLADRVFKVLANKRISRARREAAIGKLFARNFHTRSIGVFVLGRHWRGATPEQRKAYLKVFERLIVKTYTVRLSQYSGEKFKVGKAVALKGGAYTVDSVVLREGRGPINVRWTMRRARSGLKIVDVTIDNFSMAQTQRDEFAAILRQRGSLDGLIAALEEKVTTLDQG